MFDLIRDIAQGFVTVGAKVASNTTETVRKVATDTRTAVTKIAGDSASTARKVAGDIASTGTKIVGDSVSTFAKVGSDVAGTGIKIAKDVGDTANQILLGENITSILDNVLYDGLGTGVRIVTDCVGTLAKTTGDVVGTLAKVLSDSYSTAFKVVKDSLSTADMILLDVLTTVRKVRDDTLTTGFQAASCAVSSPVADVFLKYATDVFTAAGDAAVIDAILQVIHHSLQAMTQSLSGAVLIWRGILTNGANEDTLGFILNDLYDLLRFLYDLVKPENVIPGYPAADGTIKNRADEFPGSDNPYNELDLRLAQNRHAIVYQVQRVALTLIAILKMGREQVPPSGIGNLHMDVSLPSDFDKDGTPPPPTYLSRLGGGSESPPNEKWLFINGIANEFVWFQRSCDKIRDTFQREVKGIYNRSDGILWDLIECCGEHSAAGSENALIERTQSSKAAQESLERELSDALWPIDRSAPDKVVMIAHSQGCLLLRLALQTLVKENPRGSRRGSQRRRDMKERLRVFTFGNPSIDWRVIGGTGQSLSEYTNATEHFAHKVDFVAMLGVVTHRDDQNSGYDKDSVFYSKEGRAHLFGAHYPLGAESYDNGVKSKLLRAVYGREIA
ncbi:Hypothetical protein NCS54_01482500 [Fusarium falciforme]|uniref:Hypothetical protein n=1 Tax=Fusarium falciforme TaxID=195108 RepID=UPI0023018535|nr:Hypothetical protein NCS54_01482500 [Fusarium falciforme]WAO97116.1 Hypothetical protein NCS54_01482500 [Fusarium falciforme]